MCKFLCGLFKKEKNHDVAMTMAKSANVSPYPITSGISPVVDIETHYTLEEQIALAIAFSRRFDQLSGDGSQVFANVTSANFEPPRP